MLSVARFLVTPGAAGDVTEEVDFGKVPVDEAFNLLNVSAVYSRMAHHCPLTLSQGRTAWCCDWTCTGPLNCKPLGPDLPGVGGVEQRQQQYWLPPVPLCGTREQVRVQQQPTSH